MRLPVSWLRDFVDVDESPEEIAEKLALRGFEVASIETPGADNGGDTVIDLEVTANRPDCLGVLGLAREVATLYDRPLTLPRSSDAISWTPTFTFVHKIPRDAPDRVAVTIEDEELCPRYVAAVADLTSAQSPPWMTSRLRAAGIRPISPIVDVTNYVLFEIGQPMHAFDLDKLVGAEIRVRRARPGETITTLDGLERKLELDMLVIADRDRAQAIAGVMGGARSEVSDTTTHVVFESAYFKPSSVRRTSKRLGLKTEASARFERGADVNVAQLAMVRAVTLMEAIGAGRAVAPVVDRYPRPRGPLTILLRRDRLTRLLGATVADGDVERFLRGLGFEVGPASEGWIVRVPTFRVDVLREADLIEEVGRHYGFDKLEPSFPAVVSPAAPPDPRTVRDQLLRRVLTAAGLSEAVTFGFIEAKAADAFKRASPVPDLTIANPLSAKFDTLRSSLLPGLVDAVAHNRRHGRRDVRLFEIGTRFTASGETRGVAIAWTGGGSLDHWSGGARDVDFFDVKGIVELIGKALGVPLRFVTTTEPFLVAGQAAAVATGPGVTTEAEGALTGGLIGGLVGQLAPDLADVRGLPRQDRVFVAELDLDALERARIAGDDATRPLPRHPFVVRDLSIVVADTLPAEIIRGTIQSAGGGVSGTLVDVSFFDRYQGASVPTGRVSLSVRLTFQAADRTLTDREVQESIDTILAVLVREHHGVQR